jgi:hypothetical protein
VSNTTTKVFHKVIEEPIEVIEETAIEEVVEEPLIIEEPVVETTPLTFTEKIINKIKFWQ